MDPTWYKVACNLASSISKLTATVIFSRVNKRKTRPGNSSSNRPGFTFSDFEMSRSGRISGRCWRRFTARLRNFEKICDPLPQQARRPPWKRGTKPNDGASLKKAAAPSRLNDDGSYWNGLSPVCLNNESASCILSPFSKGDAALAAAGGLWRACQLRPKGTVPQARYHCCPGEN